MTELGLSNKIFGLIFSILFLVRNSSQPVPSPRMGGQASLGGIAPENALDALLDELQTFAKPPNHNDQLQVDIIIGLMIKFFSFVFFCFYPLGF